MSYPEPTPILRGKACEEFQRRLNEFKLTPEQVEFYRDARKIFKEK